MIKLSNITKVFQQGTRTGGANNAINLPGRNMQADVIQRLNAAIPLLEYFGDIGKFNHQLFIIV